MIQSFIVEHFVNKEIYVYCGGPDRFQGKVESCDDGVLTIKKDDRYTHIVTDKIVAMWAIS